MPLALGNLLGAVANSTAAFSHEKTLKSFLNNIDDYGVQVANNFEVNFSGLQDITFRITNLTLPSIKVNTQTLFYNGRSVPVTVNYDYDHDISFDILNDANGYLYPIISQFIMNESTNQLVNSGYTMVIKALTGDSKYKGMVITCRGVKLTNIAGLNYGQSSNDAQTFTVNGQLIDYSVTPGALDKVAGIAGTVTSLIR